MEKAKKIIMWTTFPILTLILFVSAVILIDSFINPLQVPSFFGWKPFIVLTDSMENTIMSGDVVIVKEIKNTKPKINDIIAFKHENVYVTHRIIDIKNDDNQKYITKGDKNRREDKGYVLEDAIEGIYKYRIPKLGTFAMFIQTPFGMLICLSIPILFIIYQQYKDNKYEKAELEQKIKELENKKRS